MAPVKFPTVNGNAYLLTGVLRCRFPRRVLAGLRPGHPSRFSHPRRDGRRAGLSIPARPSRFPQHRDGGVPAARSQYGHSKNSAETLGGVTTWPVTMFSLDVSPAVLTSRPRRGYGTQQVESGNNQPESNSDWVAYGNSRPAAFFYTPQRCRVNRGTARGVDGLWSNDLRRRGQMTPAKPPQTGWAVRSEVRESVMLRAETLLEDKSGKDRPADRLTFNLVRRGGNLTPPKRMPSRRLFTQENTR